MEKFLLYIGLIFLLIYWFLILPFKNVTERQKQEPLRKKSKEGDLRIDYDPDKEKKSHPKGYKGGEYVDYEEVK
jgi:hypothetical protein